MKTLEMLPPGATLSHEKGMSPKSENPTGPCTCARNSRLRMGPGQHAQKTHAVYSGMYSRQESPNSGAPRKPIAAALSIRQTAGWPSANQVRRSDSPLTRNAAPESVRLTILRAKLKSAIRVFRD